TLGGDFPGLAAFQLHDPLLFLLFLFPGDRIAYGIEFMFAVQLSIAGFSASVLLNNRYKCSWMSLLFSTAYSFSAFFFGYFVLTIYFGCIAILPLVVYFFLEFLEGKRSSLPFVLTSALYIYINYHMGFMLVIFIVLLYLSRLMVDPGYRSVFGRFVYAGLTVLLMDGFFLIRTGLSLIGEKSTEGADYGFYRKFAFNQVFANLFSGSTRNQYMPLMYCSMAAFFFAVFYFMSKSFSLREKAANALLLGAVLVSMWINTLDAVWHGFNNPEEFYSRYAYYVSFIIVVLGYRGFSALITGNGEGKGDGIRLSAVFVLFLLYMGWLTFTGNAYLDRERLIVNAVIICVLTAAAFGLCRGGRGRLAAFILLALVSVPDMLYDAKVTYIRMNADDGELPLLSGFQTDYARIKEAVDHIKAEDDGFYRLEKDFDRAVNDPALFDYIGLSHDSSCEKDAVNRYLTNYGFRETVYYTFYNGGSTSFADSFLGVRYLVSDRDRYYKPYEYMAEAGGYDVYKNNHVLPMAYLAPAALEDFRFEEKNTFEKQNDLASCWTGWGDGRIYKAADFEYETEGALEDEPGHFVRTEEEGYIVYKIHITENSPLYLYFAAPHMQSGEVFVNGESLGWYFTENRWNVLCAGSYAPGDTVEIRMQILKEDLEISEACFYYEDAGALAEWSENARGLNEKMGDVEEVKSSYLRFSAETG
ncbi:MAG: YfhO family protein, partial [Lachnospiraceae bacterium]|nr:YfhO family protein [Lachnospiraceae bacterium]